MKLMINGKSHQTEVDPGTPLLWVLRDELGLTGTKFGCGIGQCGACTVHVDGEARRSCSTPISLLGDSEITTIEGLAGPVATSVQEAWREIDVPQCGYCQSGQIMSGVALLMKNARPTDSEIDAGMRGNVCRCATYHRIRLAIHNASGNTSGNTSSNASGRASSNVSHNSVDSGDPEETRAEAGTLANSAIDREERV